MNAASSSIRRDRASERPADSLDAIALIYDPLVNRIHDLKLWDYLLRNKEYRVA